MREVNILNVSVGGFTNIERVNLNLGGFNALIALNNYGKSNVTRAIRFGVDFINGLPKDKSKLMAVKSLIPINKNIDNKPYRFEITLSIKDNKNDYLVFYGFSFDWIKNKGKGKKIKEEFLKIKSEKPDSRYKTYIKRNTRKGLYLSSKTGRCDREIKVKDNELIINKIVNFDDLFYVRILDVINNLSIPYIDTLQDPNTLFRKIDSSIVRTGYSLKMPNNSDVAFFIYSLKQLKNDLYEIFEDSIKSLLSDVEEFEPIEIDFKKQFVFDEKEEDIPLEFPDKIYDIRIKERNNNQQGNISSLSSGSQKLFYILAFTIAAEINNIPLIVFEELENSIHPGLLQKLLIILDGIKEKTKIITTSHSPYLIQYLEPQKIKIGIPNNEGLAIFKEIKKSKFSRVIKIAEDEGISVGDLIFDRIIDYSSGDYDLLNDLC